MEESLPTRLKRLHFRSWHRGCKETDVILGTFCDRHLHDLEPETLDLYEALLDESDADIWDWLIDRKPSGKYAPLIAILQQYKAE